MMRIAALLSGALVALVIVLGALRAPAVAQMISSRPGDLHSQKVGTTVDAASTVVFLPTVSKQASATPTPTPTATRKSVATASKTPTSRAPVGGSPSRTPTSTRTVMAGNGPAATSTPTNTPTESVTVVPRESFENAPDQWLVSTQAAGGGSVEQSDAQAASGAHSVRASITGSGGSAIVYQSFSDYANDHIWGERPGTWHWQGARIYLPSAVADRLSGSESLTLGGMWPTGSPAGFGWRFQVRQDGRIWIDGYNADGQHEQFDLYGTFPVDQWVTVEMGLHSQGGPGVKRAFALVVNGNFYGWFHQGRMVDETFDRAAFGLLGSTADGSAELYVDDWFTQGTGQFPTGPDHRPTNHVQEIDYRRQDGIGWQIDWSTWGNDLVMDPVEGLYSDTNRLQAGMNIERMPNLTDGWGEIEFGWPKGTPFTEPDGAFTGMIAFRKEINREENLEISVVGVGDGGVDLWLDAWVNSGPVIQATWPLPEASLGGTHIPEPGDVLRVWWNSAPANSLHVRVRYYDASADKWFDAIDKTYSMSITRDGVTVDFNDGFHTASAITIDSSSHSIRRFKVGTPDTAPAN